jgi:DNA-binding CsgD family transcriptional regulator
MGHHLSCGQYERMLDIVVMLLDDPDAGPDVEPGLNALCDALDADGGILADGIPGIRQRILSSTSEMPRMPVDTLNQDLPPHPLVVHYATTSDHEPRSVDDVVPHGWRRLPDYTVVRDLLGISPQRCMRQFAVPLYAPTGSARAFAVYRAGAEFSDDERGLAARIQPVLHRLDRHLQVLSRYRKAHIAGNEAWVAAGLTPREFTVLALLGECLTAAAIGRKLQISVSTVNTHLEHLYRKLGTNDRMTTVLLAQELHLIPAPDLLSAR